MSAYKRTLTLLLSSLRHSHVQGVRSHAFARRASSSHVSTCSPRCRRIGLKANARRLCFCLRVSKITYEEYAQTRLFGERSSMHHSPRSLNREARFSALTEVQENRVKSKRTLTLFLSLLRHSHVQGVRSDPPLRRAFVYVPPSVVFV